MPRATPHTRPIVSGSVDAASLPALGSHPGSIRGRSELNPGIRRRSEVDAGSDQGRFKADEGPIWCSFRFEFGPPRGSTQRRSCVLSYGHVPLEERARARHGRGRLGAAASAHLRLPEKGWIAFHRRRQRLERCGFVRMAGTLLR